MPIRKTPLVENEIYHIYTRSIFQFHIFRSDNDFQRLLQILRFYNTTKSICRFSEFLRLSQKGQKEKLYIINNSSKKVKILAYCIMPTHIHLILQQSENNSISRYMNTILKAYSIYFNFKYNRLGPLWEGRFKSVLVTDNEQLLHLTRYIHLNPTTSNLTNKPEEWKYSSYKEYLNLEENEKKICDFSDYIDMNVVSYRDFTNDQILYQRELNKIKHLLLE